MIHGIDIYIYSYTRRLWRPIGRKGDEPTGEHIEPIEPKGRIFLSVIKRCREEEKEKERKEGEEEEEEAEEEEKEEEEKKTNDNAKDGAAGLENETVVK